VVAAYVLAPIAAVSGPSIAEDLALRVSTRDGWKFAFALKNLRRGPGGRQGSFAGVLGDFRNSSRSVKIPLNWSPYGGAEGVEGDDFWDFRHNLLIKSLQKIYTKWLKCSYFGAGSALFHRWRPADFMNISTLFCKQIMNFIISAIWTKTAPSFWKRLSVSLLYTELPYKK
jgi:hypothetical protein